MVVISPWPKSGTDLDMAVSTLKDSINPGASINEIERLGATASARVELYAPGAPTIVRSESVIRFAAYLHEAESGAVRADSINVGEIRTETTHVTNHAAAFRNCGAMALLSPWKRRRAGAITKSKREKSIMPSEQLPSIPLTESPVNIADGLSPGKYQFQVSLESDGLTVVLYAYGQSAPSELSHYFRAEPDDVIGFTVVTGTRLWARVRSNNQSATVAIARL